MSNQKNIIPDTDSALKLCIEKGWRKPGEGLNDFNEDDETALESAFWFSDIKPDEIKLLIIAGADPNHCYISKEDPQENSGIYPIYWALRGCHLSDSTTDYGIAMSKVITLLEMGANPSLYLPFHNTSILEGAIFDYEIRFIMLRYKEELHSLWNESGKTVKDRIDVLYKLSEKYGLPPVDHFYETIKYSKE